MDDFGTLMVSPGRGRVFRARNHIGYSTTPIKGLYETVISAEQASLHVFKELAMLVVKRDFAVSAFAVIRLDDDPAVFVFGDIGVVTAVEEATIGGSNSATWTERQLSADEARFLQMGTEPSTEDSKDTVLLGGNIPGGGFTFGRPPQNSAKHVPAEKGWTPTEPEFDNAADEDDQIDVDPGFDPFADPANIDLEQLGSAVSTDDPVDSSEPPSVEQRLESIVELNEDNLGESRSVSVEAVSPVQFRIPQQLDSLPPLRPSGGSNQSNSLHQNLDVEDLTIPQPTQRSDSPRGPLAPRSSLGTLRFDDGQVHELTQSLLVGRYPTKNGLPDGYDYIVIRGEHVSRIHWELRVEHGQAFAVDLGSTSGTSIEQPAGQPPTQLAHNQSHVLSDGARIVFGDRWVGYESWRD